MWAAVKLFFSGATAKIVEWAVVAGSITAAILAIFLAGKRSERANELQTTQKEVKEADDVENKNRMRPDGAAFDELQSKWSR